MAEARGAEPHVQNLDDLYMLLNVDRLADSNDIRTAYLKLASCLHPDKACNAAIQKLSRQQQNGPTLDNATRLRTLRLVRQRADAQFVLVDRAYRVLSDPAKRLVYDEYGVEGLRAFELSEMAKTTVGVSLKSPAQVRQLLDELLTESAQRRLEATLGMSGRISADCRFLPIIGVNGHLIARNMVPDVTQVVVQQSVGVPLGDVSHLTFGGYALHRNGVGMGSTFLALRHHVTPTVWLGTNLDLGYRPKISASFGRTADKNGGVNQVNVSYGEAGAAGKWTTAKQINSTTMCNASFGMGADEGVTVHAAKVVREGFGKVRAEVRVSAADMGVRLSYQHFLKSVARSLQMNVKLGTRGVEVEMGAKRVLPSDVKLNTALRMSLEGITAVLRVQRGGMQLQFPVLVGAVATGWTLAVGGLIPAAVDSGVGWLLATSWKKRAARLRAEREPIRRRQLFREIKSAASQTALMQKLADKNAAEEREKGGLVILCARYGCRLSQDCGSEWWVGAADQSESESADLDSDSDAGLNDLIFAPNMNVTVPLQFFVRESSLTLPRASKSSLLGFYTPAPCPRRRRPRRTVVLSQLTSRNAWSPDGQQGWDADLDQFGFGFEGSGGAFGSAGEDGEGPPKPRLYIRYVFAGRVFEETFEDNREVVVPSSSATYMGGEEVR